MVSSFPVNQESVNLILSDNVKNVKLDTIQYSTILVHYNTKRYNTINFIVICVYTRNLPFDMKSKHIIDLHRKLDIKHSF